MYPDHASMIEESGLRESDQIALRNLIEAADCCGEAGDVYSMIQTEGRPSNYARLAKAIEGMILILTEREARKR